MLKNIKIISFEIGNECNLRFTPPKNGQKKGVKMAEDYEGDKMIERILNS